ncbi:MAG UNVERIFIED_CONTAM: hypothetical protein LVT10_25985 [Anaerolineae bacterium]
MKDYWRAEQKRAFLAEHVELQGRETHSTPLIGRASRRTLATHGLSLKMKRPLSKVFRWGQKTASVKSLNLMGSYSASTHWGLPQIGMNWVYGFRVKRSMNKCLSMSAISIMN